MDLGAITSYDFIVAVREVEIMLTSIYHHVAFPTSIAVQYIQQVITINMKRTRGNFRPYLEQLSSFGVAN